MNRKLSFLFLIGLFSVNAFSQEIRVEYGFNFYSLKMTKDEITYIKKDFEAVVKKEPCSTNLFNDFVERFSDLTKNKPQNQTAGSEFLVKYQVDKKAGVLTPNHPFAQKLLNIPNSFDIFKLATEFRCQKGKQ